MKRNGLRKSLLKIKKELNTNQEKTNYLDPVDPIDEPKCVCTCKDAQGNIKMLYTSQKEAKEASVYLKETKLHIYPCPSEKGWHLTKG